jgi:multidrug/hemolysin transport system ATP-binding protein
MLIKAEKLTMQYGSKVVLNNLNIKIPEGTLIAYLGTNGAGKSTTMHLLTGLMQPTSGEITYKSNLKIGVVFQNSVLDDGLTVRENLDIRAKMEGNVSREWKGKLIDSIGLINFLDQRYGTLSGGQKRRVDIARALLAKPDLLFLDEPTTGLDLQTREIIWKLINDLREQQRLSIFLTTHYLEEAELADNIYVLANGNLLAEGSAAKLVLNNAKSKLVLTLDTDKKLKFQGLTWQEAHAKITQY